MNITFLLLIRIIRFLAGTQGKILAICLLEHIGDIVAAEPIARYARRTYPKAEIVWCIRRPYRELVQFNPNIDRVLVLECLAEWIVLKRLRLFDQVLELHMNLRGCSICKRQLIKTAGNTEITPANFLFFGNLLSMMCQTAGIPILNENPRLYLPVHVARKVDQLILPEHFAVIHASANSGERNWDTDRWFALVDRMVNELKFPVVEVGLAPVIRDGPIAQYRSVCGELSLLETAEVIRRADLFIGVDSGPAHFAHAVETYGIVLIGRVSVFDRYMPYAGNYSDSSNAEVIYANGPASIIPIEAVMQGILRRLRLPSHSLTVRSPHREHVTSRLPEGSTSLENHPLRNP